MTTFAAVLAEQLRRDPGRPLVTHYDHLTGERTELSVTSYANWVAKTAGLLADELDLERGQAVRIDLPVHWLVPVLLGAAWTVGLVVTTSPDADLVVCGPDALDPAPRAGVVLASALHPLGLRFDHPLPEGVVDLGAEVWSQPDAFAAYDPPGPDDPATEALTQAEVWRAAAAGSLLTDGGRLFSEANPASPPELASFTEPLVRGGSLVLLAHGDPARVEDLCRAERVTARYGPAGSPR
jgi:uncharacterized protein (TIGR03089 family)